jgi:hypothetical protein
MHATFKMGLIAAATGLLGMIAANPSMAQGRVPANDWMAFHDSYQGPHGHYNSLADFTRDINGTPCGMNCTAARAHWLHAYGR